VAWPLKHCDCEFESFPQPAMCILFASVCCTGNCIVIGPTPSKRSYKMSKNKIQKHGKVKSSPALATTTIQIKYLGTVEKWQLLYSKLGKLKCLKTSSIVTVDFLHRKTHGFFQYTTVLNERQPSHAVCKCKTWYLFSNWIKYTTCMDVNKVCFYQCILFA
jgi:hypothetical protein